MNDFENNNNTPSENDDKTADSQNNYENGKSQNDTQSSAENNQPVNNQNNYHPNNGYPYSGSQNNGYSGSSPYGYQSNNNQQPKGNYVYYGDGQFSAQPKPVKSTPSKHKKGGIITFVTAIVLCVALGVTGIFYSLNGGFEKGKTSADDSGISNVIINDTPNVSTTSSDGELTAAGVYEKVHKSSVGVIVYSGSKTSSASNEGSGIIVGENSSGKYTYIVTCAHVISGGGTIRVQLYDEKQYDATVVGYDSKTDIGVLRIEETGLQAAELGSSDKTIVGETVYAIGNPGGTAFAGSFTNGMVSAISRPVDSEIGYEMSCIQHTAAINPGNSGGALVNGHGQVIGINSSKIASTDYEGMGFAVPSITVKEVFDEIIANGYVTNRPKLGITYTPASSSQMYSMIVSLKELPAGSLIVQSIQSDSSLSGTDVKQGDLITKANGKDLESADDLPNLIESSAVGDKLTLTVCRIDSNYNVSEFEVTITLVEDKGDTVVQEQTTSNSSYNPFGAYGYGN